MFHATSNLENSTRLFPFLSLPATKKRNKDKERKKKSRPSEHFVGLKISKNHQIIASYQWFDALKLLFNPLLPLSNAKKSLTLMSVTNKKIDNPMAILPCIISAKWSTSMRAITPPLQFIPHWRRKRMEQNTKKYEVVQVKSSVDERVP